MSETRKPSYCQHVLQKCRLGLLTFFGTFKRIVQTLSDEALRAKIYKTVMRHQQFNPLVPLINAFALTRRTLLGGLHRKE